MIPGFGMNVVLKHQSESDLRTYIDSLKKLKTEWIRLELNYFDPIPEVVLDFFVREVHQSGIKILGLLTGLVPGTFINCTAPGLKFWNPLDRLDSYIEFVTKYVSRYQSSIDHWEIWNEPNTLRFWIKKPNSSEFVRLIKETSPIIRSLQPNSTIVMGGIMGDDTNVYAPFQKIDFLRECLEKGIDDFVDIYNFHPYIPACYMSWKKKEFYTTEIKRSINLYLEKYHDVNKPHWISEIGICPLWVRVSQREIAEVLFELYQYSRSLNLHYFLWTLTDFNDKEYSRLNPETAFGVLNWELEEKELYKGLVEDFSKLNS
ncbi:MAG: cellulase family glycosylhydrolase [Leptospiraceae bacterium]|nr:cellulase family glycosylhydrolase [Leptospiraceae bacterium]